MQTKQDYEAQMNGTFSIELDEGVLELTLVEVSGVTAEKVERGQTEPFSAVFQSNITDMLEQGSYQVRHDSAGELLIFLVPIGPNETGMRYEAIFT